MGLNRARVAILRQVPVIDGFSFPNLTKRIDIAGRHVSAFLLELLQRRGYAFNRSADLETVRQLKEKASFVALNYNQELQVPALPPDQHLTRYHHGMSGPCCFLMLGACVLQRYSKI